MDCHFSNVIYKLSCSGCEAYYTGQTGAPLSKRMTVHRQQIARENYSILGTIRHIKMRWGIHHCSFLSHPTWIRPSPEGDERSCLFRYSILYWILLDWLCFRYACILSSFSLMSVSRPTYLCINFWFQIWAYTYFALKSCRTQRNAFLICIFNCIFNFKTILVFDSLWALFSISTILHVYIWMCIHVYMYILDVCML